MTTQKSVTIYSTPSCHFCHLAKDYFNEHGVEYTEYDVASDIDKRKEMVTLTGQLGVPVIVVGDNIVVGFNEAHIEELLQA